MSRLIDADALMEASKYEFWQDGSAITPIGEYILGKFRQLIRNMPTVTPEPKWIPCSERLPEVNGRYLVTRGLNACGAMWNRVYLINYSDVMGLKSERIWWNGNVGKSDFERIDDVIAWMPLQEPYRAERRTDGTEQP